MPATSKQPSDPRISSIKRNRIANPPDVYQGLFGEQTGLLYDPSRMKAAVCSRRAGKTYCVTRAMIKACLARPGALVGYLTKTREWAEDLVWEPLRSICKKNHLYGDFNSAKLKCVFPNKSRIKLASAKDKAATEPLRGFAYDLLVIDEAGSIDPTVMRYVVKEILPAALGDHRGTLLVVGTPNESCAGYFHDITTGKNKWKSVHHWVQRQNVMFPRWAHIKDEPARLAAVEEYLAEERATYHLAESDPEYRREYLGVWAKNEELFIYRISEDNLAQPPQDDLRYILAIDLGWHDMTAFELVGYDSYSQKLYEVHSTQEQHLTFDEIKNIAVDYLETVEVDKIVLDTAGAGKIAQETMAKEVSQRFQVPCVAAQKNRKATNMKLLNSDLRAEKVFLLPDGVCVDQMKSLQWSDHVLREKEPEPGQFIDNADAFLYAYRESYHWLHEPREEIPEVNTREYSNWEMDKIEQDIVDRVDGGPETEWWEDA